MTSNLHASQQHGTQLSLDGTIAAAAAHAAREAAEAAEADAHWENLKVEAIRDSLPKAAERLTDVTGRTDLTLITTPEEAGSGWDGWSTGSFHLRYSAPDGLIYIASGHTMVAGERVHFTLSVEHTTSWGAVDNREFSTAAGHLEALTAMAQLQEQFTPEPKKRRRWLSWR